MAEPVKRWIFNDDHYDFDEYKKAYCETWEEEAEDVDDNEVWQYISDCIEDDYNYEVKEQLTNFADGNYIIGIGTAGLWHGRYSGSLIAEDMMTAIQKFTGSDDGYLRIWDENGELHASFSHHDGTHFVHYKRVTDDGYDYYTEHMDEGDMDECDILNKIFETPEFSEDYHYAEQQFGCPAVAWE